MKWWLVLWSMALVAVSCGSGSAEEVSAAPAAVAAEPAASPLEERLGFSSEPGLRQFQLISLQQEADRTIVDCMSDAGFFYAVERSEDLFRSGASVGDGSRAWVEVNGLGITTSFVDALAIEAGPATVADAAGANQSYVASLSAEQAVAYDSALVGVGSTDASGQFAPAGCWGSAYTEIVQVLSILDEFESDIISVNDRLMVDPRFDAFQAEWSECMAAAGHRYPGEQEMVDDVYARLLEIELAESDGSTTIVSPPAVDALLQFERSVALASFDCRLIFADDVAQLRVDYEQEFLADNRFRLAELVPPA